MTSLLRQQMFFFFFFSKLECRLNSYLGTVCAAVNVIGNIVPPMMILPGRPGLLEMVLKLFYGAASTSARFDDSWQLSNISTGMHEAHFFYNFSQILLPCRFEFYMPYIYILQTWVRRLIQTDKNRVKKIFILQFAKKSTENFRLSNSNSTENGGIQMLKKGKPTSSHLFA